MQIQMYYSDHNTYYSDQNQSMEVIPQPTDARNVSIKISDVRTVKVSNLPLAVTSNDVQDFLSFSGDIQYVEMRRESERTQLAFVTFTDSQGADTSLLLSGSNFGNRAVPITPVEDYELPPEASETYSDQISHDHDSPFKKAEEVVSYMLAKGYVLGQGILERAKTFDKQIHFSSNASAIDRKIGLLEMLGEGASVVNDKVKEMDEWLQISEMTKSAFSAVGSAGSAMMSNRLVSAGASFVSGAYSVVSRAAGDVSSMTMEKVGKANEDKWETPFKRSLSINLPTTHQEINPGGHPI